MSALQQRPCVVERLLDGDLDVAGERPHVGTGNGRSLAPRRFDGFPDNQQHAVQLRELAALGQDLLAPGDPDRHHRHSVPSRQVRGTVVKILDHQSLPTGALGKDDHGGAAARRLDQHVGVLGALLHVEALDEQRAEEARRRAAELRQSKQVDSEDFAYLSAKIEKELTRLKLKRKYRHLPSTVPTPREMG